MFAQVEARNHLNAVKVQRKKCKDRKSIDEIFRLLDENPSPEEYTNISLREHVLKKRYNKQCKNEN